VSYPTVLSVKPGSAAEQAGIVAGDTFISLGGSVPRDIIEYQLLVDEAEVEIEIDRGGVVISVTVEKLAGEPLGAEISSALFDRVRTCDNHCEFCFIYQLPKGMRKSLYMKDDDYRLSFLYGNFTTLTRFTEGDLERIVTQRLSPLFVSLHTTDPDLRSSMLRNPRGAISLRWLSALLDEGIEVHGQVVLCPGVNDAAVLDRTLGDIAISYSQLASVGVVPLGLSRFSKEPTMRATTEAEAAHSLDIIERYQELFLKHLGHRMVYASDELYLLARRPFPDLDRYGEFPQHENGIGMFRAFEASFLGDDGYAWGRRSGFFDSVDGAPHQGYRPHRYRGPNLMVGAPQRTAVLTGSFGIQVLRPLLDEHGFSHVETLEVPNHFFGGNTGVAGLMTGSDVSTVLDSAPSGVRYLLPDVCLNEGVFLDGMTVAELPKPVEVVATDGASLRRALRSEKSEREVVVSHG
jgi:NifB/MoaA-like Fe-S oxidoreductase